MSNRQKPPKLPLRFFRWFCHPEYLEDIEGDLVERFENRVIQQGEAKARWLFALDIVMLLRPGLVKGFANSYKMSKLGMFGNYVLTAVRNSKREKAFTFLNVLGLSIGITACLYIGMYSLNELRYDSFHEKADRIYRINQTFIWGGTDKLFDSTGPAVMGAIQEEVPEFETMTRVHTADDALVASIDGSTRKVFEENRILAVDPTFFQVFTFPLISGNPVTALAEPNSVIITSSTAEKYFGSADALGKQLTMGERGKEKTFQVTGVAADVPSNSHIQFNFLISISSLDRLKRNSDSWWWTTFVTFGVLRPDADVEHVAGKVAAVPGKYLGPFLQKYKGMSYEEFVASGEPWDLFIQPLPDIHLRSADVISRLNEVGDIKTIYVLISIAGLILLLSVINFVNLTTARSSRRAKEVGVRKVLGSGRTDLVWQFMLESVLFCLIALIVSISLILLLMPYINSIAGKKIPLALIGDPLLLATTLVITIFIGILAGIYPAFYLSAFQPGQVLKGRVIHGAKRSLMRNFLVTVQFTVSISLIICAIVVNQQVSFWMNMDLGFDRENKLIIQNAERLETSMEAFQNEVAAFSPVDKVSFSSDTPPGVGDSDGNFYLKGNDEVSNQVSFWVTDENFADIYGLKLIAGRNFSRAFDDSKGVVVSRSLTKAFGLADPTDALERHLLYDDKEYRIVGVIEDVNTELFWEQLPVALFYKGGFETPNSSRELTVSFNKELSGDEISLLLAELEGKWSTFNPDAPFMYTFLDKEFERTFESTTKFGQLISLYSILAIFIAGLGLTGLVGYVIERRNKEIGIRKVLGASVSGVLKLLSGEFALLLFVGFVAASVLSWYVMDLWVKDFVYQVPITIVPFLLAGFTMLVIAAATLSFQTIKAARANPVKYLKEE